MKYKFIKTINVLKKTEYTKPKLYIVEQKKHKEVEEFRMLKFHTDQKDVRYVLEIFKNENKWYANTVLHNEKGKECEECGVKNPKFASICEELEKKKKEIFLELIHSPEIRFISINEYKNKLG